MKIVFAMTLLGFLTVATSVQATAIQAYDATGANPAGSTSSLNIGREFVVSGGGIVVTSLGVYDAAGSGGLVNPHDVTLFSIGSLGGNPSNTPLTTVNIPSGTSATLSGGFRFEPITPYFLPAGNYAVIAYGLDTGVNGNGDPYADGGGLLASPNANDFRFDPYQFTTASSPAFPANGDSNNHSSASFQFVPEPSSVVLFGLGAVGLILAARRRRTA